MDTLKIIDFDHTIGGFTAGLEQYNQFEVVQAPWLSADTALPYNSAHKNLFDVDRQYTEQDWHDNNCDITVFNPDFGQNFQTRGAANFNYDELLECFTWIENFGTDYIIFTTKPNTLPFLSTSSFLTYTADRWPVYDMISTKLSYKYDVYQFVLDGAYYGIPQHIYMNFYVCIRKGVSHNDLFILDKAHTIQTGYNTIKDAIGDIGLHNYNDYTSKYIEFCRKGNVRLTCHRPKFNYRHICSEINEGSSASRTESVSQKTGYIRPKYDKIAPHLSNDFYNVSSKYASIHPYFDRPFTIREGARLFGIPDIFSWNSSLSNKRVGQMIFDSVSPIFGFVLAKTILHFES